LRTNLLKPASSCPDVIQTLAETITLLGFVSSSISQIIIKYLDVNEAAEFAVSLVTAMSAQKVLYSYLEKKGCEKDDFGRFDPLCFRR